MMGEVVMRISGNLSKKGLSPWMRASLYSGTILTLLGAPAYAAEAEQPAAADGGAEIIVTANKRESTIQKTPMSITAVTGEQLQNRGIARLEDAIRSVPSVTVRSAGPGQTELSMRGLAAAGGSAPTVGFYLDDIALTPPVGSWSRTVIDPSLYDLARVEVLRGPQGTLYGGGSMGGTIRLITNQPKLDEFGGSVSIDGSMTKGGNKPNGTLSVALNIPLLKDKAAFRLAATESYVGGWIDRVVVDPFPFPTGSGCAPFQGCDRGAVENAPVAKRFKNVNWTHTTNVRGTLLVKPTDNITSTTTGLIQYTRQGGANTFDVPPGEKYMAHFQPFDIAEPYRDKFWLIGNSTAIDMNFATLTFVTSYWKRNQALTQDTTEAYQNYFNLPAFPTNPYEIQLGWNDVNQFSEEVRLASNGEGRFKWMAGAFYANLKSVNRSFTQDPALCGFSNGGCPANPDGIIFDATQIFKVKQYAFFGEASFKITPELTFTAGGRYFNFDNSLDLTQNGYFTPSGNLGITKINSEKKNKGFTPKFNLSYEPNSNLTLYATAAQGFRPGGVNQTVPVTGPGSCLPGLQALGLTQAPSGYDADKIWTYEGGGKFRGKGVTFNGSFYYNKWSGIQQLLTLPCGFGYTTNAGTAETYGPEVEASFQLTPELSAQVSGTYTHAKLTSVVAGTGYSVGQQILNIPKYQVTGALTYSRTVGDNLLLTLRAEDTLVGPAQDVSYSYYRLPSYNLLNLRMQVERDNWSAALYVNNVTNEVAQISANNTGMSVNSPALFRIATNQPLTVGVNYNYRF